MRSTSRRSLSPLKAFFLAAPVVFGLLALVAMASTSDLAILTTTGEEDDQAQGSDDTSATTSPTTQPSAEDPTDAVAEDGTADQTGANPGQPEIVGDEGAEGDTTPTTDGALPDVETDDDTSTTIEVGGSNIEAGADATPTPGGTRVDRNRPPEDAGNEPSDRTAPTGAEPSAGDTETSDDSFVDRLKTLGILTLSGVGVVVFLYLAVSLLRSLLSGRRQTNDEDDDSDLLLGPDGEPMIDPLIALDRLDDELTAEPHPRQAIRKAYAVVESGFGHPELARKRGETPLLYLQRALGSIEEGNEELAELTQLFVLARYSDHQITEPMRRSAIDAVVGLRDHYRDAAKAVPV